MRLTEREEDIGFSGALALVIIAVVLALTSCASKGEQPTADDTIKAGAVDAAIATARLPCSNSLVPLPAASLPVWKSGILPVLRKWRKLCVLP